MEVLLVGVVVGVVAGVVMEVAKVDETLLPIIGIVPTT